MRQLEEVGRGAHLIAGQAVGAQHRIGERHREGQSSARFPSRSDLVPYSTS